MKLAIVHPVCYHYRVPIFRHLTSHPALDVRIFVGSGISGTKAVNAKDTSGLNMQVMWTLKKQIISKGRCIPVLFNPSLPYQLIRWNPDVLLVLGGDTLNNLLVLAYAKLFRKPIVWWSLGELRGRKYSGMSAFNRRIYQFVERHATAYLGYSSVAIDYFHRMGYEPHRCFNLVNVVDTDLVKKHIDETCDIVEPLRDHLRLRDKLVLLYVGALTTSKRIDRLILAFTEIAKSFNEVRLLVIGDGPERKSAEALTKELAILDRVIFVGEVFEGVSAYFQLADLLVVPGTGGLVISEAMTHGLPVICSIGDGTEIDLIKEGRNGYLIPETGIDALVNAIRKCLSDPQKLKEMGMYSRQIIDKKHNILSFMNEMLDGIFFAYKSRKRHDDRL
jgi:glycosyltransferase involved in cell wall biosynthesis